ncbi:MAG: hypothetical protein ACRCVI_00820 [Mycoplasmoidaceae bacterium]
MMKKIKGFILILAGIALGGVVVGTAVGVSMQSQAEAKTNDFKLYFSLSEKKYQGVIDAEGGATIDVIIRFPLVKEIVPEIVNERIVKLKLAYKDHEIIDQVNFDNDNNTNQNVLNDWNLYLSLEKTLRK